MTNWDVSVFLLDDVTGGVRRAAAGETVARLPTPSLVKGEGL